MPVKRTKELSRATLPPGRKLFNRMGSREAQVLVVCDPPSVQTWKRGDVLPPTSLDLCKHMVAERELDRRNIAFITPCPPLPPYSEGIAKRENEHLQAHREGFIKQVNRFKGKRLIVAMGALASRMVYGQAVKIMKVRGLVSQSKLFPDLPILPTLAPGHILLQPVLEDYFRVDMDTLARITDHGYDYDFGAATVEKAKNYRWVDGHTLLKRYHEVKPNAVCLDTETIGGKWYEGAHAITYQFSWYNDDGELEVYVVPTWEGYEDPRHARYALPKGQAKKNLRCCKRLIEFEDYETQFTGHNLKYDVHICFNDGIDFPVWRWYHDSLQLAFACNENLRKKNLDECTKLFYPPLAGYADEFNVDPIHQGKSRMDLVPVKRLVPYAGGDVDACMHITENLIETVSRDPRQKKCYELQMRALRLFVGMERRGVRVSKERVRDFTKVLNKEQDRLYRELIAKVHPQIRQKHIEQKGPINGLKFTRKEFLQDILFAHKKGFRFKPVVFTKGTAKLPDEKDRVPSTSKKQHLPFFDTEPWVAQLIQYRECQTLNTNFVGMELSPKHKGPTGIWQYIQPADERIHPSFYLDVTVTGRTASRDPNGQNFPKRGKLAEAYRQIFMPSDGFVFGEVDLSQAELRVAAWMAHEPRMLELYRNGQDIHSATAAIIAGMSLSKFVMGSNDDRLLIGNNCVGEWPGAAKWLEDFMPLERKKQTVRLYCENLRQRAKAVNFGFLYGMGWRKFRSYAKTDYGVDFSEEGAQDVRDTFFHTYSKLEIWHDSMRAFVKKHGYVRSLHGALRRLPNIRSLDDKVRGVAERQAINSPVQRFASDIALMGAVRFADDCPQDKCRVAQFIHDAVILEIAEGYEEEMLAYMKWYMENPPLEKWFGLKAPLPIIADTKHGLDLGNMKKAKVQAIRPSFYNKGKGLNYGKRLAA